MADDHRLGLLEQRVDHIAGVTLRVDTKLDGIAETLQSLARIEERQLATTDRLKQGAETFTNHEERLRKLEVAVPENLTMRLSKIEIGMPGLIETRRWVVALVLATSALVFVTVGHMVIKGDVSWLH